MTLNDKLFRKKLLTVSFLTIALCSFFSFGVLAYWQINGKTTNRITLHSYRTEILETYDEPDAVFPGMVADKVVHVSNTGSVDCFVRVKVETMFGTRDNSGVFTRDSYLDGEMIQISYNENSWYKKGEYWYYRKVLEAGKQTEEPLFRSFRISETAGNEYKGKAAQIVVTMDSIQAQADTLQFWDVTEKELGITYEKNRIIQSDSAVIYAGREQGFLFQGLGTDLFTNFKNLLPGCSRTQKIFLENQSDSAVLLSLHADYARQDVKSKQEEEFLNKLLTEYTQIEIRNAEGILYSGPVNGNPDGRWGDSMGEHSPIFLGQLSPGQKQELIVSLTLAPEADNTISSLTGNVDWIFQASGGEFATAAVPQTGDSVNLALTFAVFCISGLFLLAFFLFRKEKYYDVDR